MGAGRSDCHGSKGLHMGYAIRKKEIITAQPQCRECMGVTASEKRCCAPAHGGADFYEREKD